MAVTEAPSHQDNRHKRKAFGWLKRLTNRSGDKSTIPLGHSKSKKNGAVKSKNNPYPQSGFVRRQHSLGSKSEGNLSYATPPSRRIQQESQDDNISYTSLPANGDRRESARKPKSNSSVAPTVATDAADTVYSDTSHGKAMTNTTGIGALSTLTDGATGNGGEGSTFSSRNQSERSLTTTLTTIQSQNPGQQLQAATAQTQQNGAHTPSSFTYQLPSSPVTAPGGVASAVPPHMHAPHPTYNQAIAGNQLTDNASIVTLASSSKRRRRSQDTDASVRALAPSSVFGGSRESLPLSVLSGNTFDGPSSPGPTAMYSASQSRPSVGGLTSAEARSVYSSQGVTAPALASERNSYYAASKRAKERMGEDAKSVSSVAGIYPKSEYDARSISEIRSGIDMPLGSGGGVGGAGGGVGAGKDYEPSVKGANSLRADEGSVRSNALGHGRNDSIPGSIGGSLNSPLFGGRQASASAAVSRRSSDFQELHDVLHEDESRVDAGEQIGYHNNDDDGNHQADGVGHTSTVDVDAADSSAKHPTVAPAVPEVLLSNSDVSTPSAPPLTTKEE